MSDQVVHRLCLSLTLPQPFRYIRLYIDNVVMKDNMSLLYRTAQRMMTVKDIRNPDSEVSCNPSEALSMSLV